MTPSNTGSGVPFTSNRFASKPTRKSVPLRVYADRRWTGTAHPYRLRPALCSAGIERKGLNTGVIEGLPVQTVKISPFPSGRTLGHRWARSSGVDPVFVSCRDGPPAGGDSIKAGGKALDEVDRAVFGPGAAEDRLVRHDHCALPPRSRTFFRWKSLVTNHQPFSIGRKECRSRLPPSPGMGVRLERIQLAQIKLRLRVFVGGRVHHR